MITENDQKPMQGLAERFVQAAEELRLTGRQLFRDGIVANDQVLSKIKKGWQKPTKKAIEAFCEKYAVSAAWMYTGEGCPYLGRRTAFEPIMELPDTRPLYRSDFTLCLDANGLPVTGDGDCLVCFPWTSISGVSTSKAPSPPSSSPATSSPSSASPPGVRTSPATPSASSSPPSISSCAEYLSCKVMIKALLLFRWSMGIL